MTTRTCSLYRSTGRCIIGQLALLDDSCLMPRSKLMWCLLTASTTGILVAQPTSTPPVPKGIYVKVDLHNVDTLAQGAAGVSLSCSDTNRAAVDAILVDYFITFLNNPAISGFAAEIPWDELSCANPGPNPSSPASGAYNWATLDDLFTAVDRWDSSHPFAPPKTIQLLVMPGFHSPLYIYNDIDRSVCGEPGAEPGAGCGSCDLLFMTSPPEAPSQFCGYTTLFWETESAPIQQELLPMPWNSVYQTDYQVFLTTLRQHIAQEPSSSAFIAIAVAGPTASTVEMILPTSGDQTAANGGNSQLTLPNGVPTISDGVNTMTAWNMLIDNFYQNKMYDHSDQPFVDAWDAAIDAYTQIFHGITLQLTTTTDALPDFLTPNPTTGVTPAAGFADDCYMTSRPNAQREQSNGYTRPSL